MNNALVKINKCGKRDRKEGREIEEARPRIFWEDNMENKSLCLYVFVCLNIQDMI